MYSTALIYSVLHSTLEFILLQSCWSERQMVGEVRADLVICTANCLFLSNALIKCFPRYGNFPTVIVNGTTQHVITSFPPTLPPPIFFLSFSFSPPPLTSHLPSLLLPRHGWKLSTRCYDNRQRWEFRFSLSRCGWVYHWRQQITLPSKPFSTTFYVLYLASVLPV